MGSSPRVRGKLYRCGPGPACPRLIPARAGKTRRPCGPRASRRAHPRACGENAAATAARNVSQGSSPRVRGKRRIGRIPARPVRLIPARAGKTRLRAWTASSTPAHPRACGENCPIHGADVPCRGSSPRVRGKLGVDHDPPPRERLIPARAGKTLVGLAFGFDSRAHPRACGENEAVKSLPIQLSGSSPRVRGKHIGHGSGSFDAGLIPARAGKTTAVWWSWSRHRAHPRACGENTRRRR